jgi:hypothetical protein
VDTDENSGLGLGDTVKRQVLAVPCHAPFWFIVSLPVGKTTVREVAVSRAPRDPEVAARRDR